MSKSEQRSVQTNKQTNATGKHTVEIEDFVSNNTIASAILLVELKLKVLWNRGDELYNAVHSKITYLYF